MDPKAAMIRYLEAISDRDLNAMDEAHNALVGWIIRQRGFIPDQFPILVNLLRVT